MKSWYIGLAWWSFTAILVVGGMLNEMRGPGALMLIGGFGMVFTLGWFILYLKEED